MSHSYELRASHTHPYPKGYCLLSSPWLENNWVLWYQQKRENPQKSCYHDWPRFLEAASPAQPFGRQIIKIGRSETISHHHYYQLKRLLLKPTMRFKKSLFCEDISSAVFFRRFATNWRQEKSTRPWFIRHAKEPKNHLHTSSWDFVVFLYICHCCSKIQFATPISIFWNVLHESGIGVDDTKRW